MNKRWLALLLALLMVMGTVGMAAAEEAIEEEVELQEEEGQGPPAHIQEMLEMKAEMEGEEDDEDEEQGPPAFVREMLERKFSIISKKNLMIQGKPFQSELPPVIKAGRTLIPVGAVVKGLGAEDVLWDAEDETVTIIKGGITIVLEIGDNKYTVIKDGEEEVLEMDTAAEILGNRTFVPLKFIAVALGEEVDWDPETGIIKVGREFGQATAAEARMKDDDMMEAELEEEEEEEE